MSRRPTPGAAGGRVVRAGAPRRGSARARTASRLWALALALGAAACASGGSGGEGDPFSGGTREIRIRVNNQNFYDASLTAISDTGRRRLGDVGGNQSATFTLPWSFVSGLRIEIDLLAGPTCVSDPIVVDPGDTVVLDIRPDLDRLICR
ncbi:MAG TPA: hypothetical protein VFQ22_06885 [Longimicrobiales bacterium]|nr:hypothetical protein [Longimicrobiales bacterium]